MKKRLLFLMSRAPYDGNCVQEMLDVILTAAAFDQDVQLLFVDNGVYQLKRGQNTTAAGIKNISSIIQALQIYEIKEYYVERESLQDRGLSANDLHLPVKLVPRSEIEQIAKSFDVVYNS